MSAATTGRALAAAPARSSTPHPPGPVISAIMSSASRHFSRWRTSSGIPARARRRRARAAATGSSSARSSQLSGQNSRQSAAHDAASFTRCTLTATWQFAVLPSVPDTAGPRTVRRPRPWGTRCHPRPAPPPADARRTTRNVPPHPGVVPGRGRDELLQPLGVHPQPLRHRHHRLTPPVRQQPAHVQLPGGPLVLPRQPAQHLRGEPSSSGRTPAISSSVTPV